MKLEPERTWLFVIVGSVIVAATSAVTATISVIGGNMMLAVISLASLALFAACAVTAWTIRSRLSEIADTEEEVKCLKLKKAGYEGSSEEIVPKGKMPKG